MSNISKQDLIVNPDYLALKRLLDTTGQNVESLQVEVNFLLNQVKLLEARNAQLIKGKAIADDVMQKTIDDINARSNAYLEENRKLKQRIGEMGE